MKKLLITDNEYIYEKIKKLLKEKNLINEFDFSYSYNNIYFNNKYSLEEIKPLNIKKEKADLIKKYDLIISAHCKQIFPKELVEKVLCVNIHPGYNPYNRGWYPQVFSIINHLPVGVTIHVMDEKLDHGKIIYQEKVNIYDWDTSLDVYERILSKEIEIFESQIDKILKKQFNLKEPKTEGNINQKKDFNNLCKLDLNEKLTMKEAIDKLRALTHGDYKNAYFYDQKGNKIYVKIKLEKEGLNE